MIGIPDEYRGQSPKAFVKLKAGAEPFTLDALKAFLKDRLGKHEMVGAIDVRAELPKTAVGKLSKKELYEEENAKRLPATAAEAPRRRNLSPDYCTPSALEFSTVRKKNTPATSYGVHWGSHFKFQNGQAMAAISRALKSPARSERGQHNANDLRQALPETVDRLKQRHADQIDADDIEAYVALNWLEWHGGGLRLTITGRNMRAQMAPSSL